MAQERRHERTSERAQRPAAPRRRRSTGSAVSFGLLYVVAVIGVSILLALSLIHILTAWAATTSGSRL